jgi:hypothetical protein
MLSAGAVVSIGLAAYVYFFSNLFTINSFSVDGVEEVTKGVLEKQLTEDMSHQWLGIFPKNKIFTYSGGTIISTVRTLVPDTAKVDIRPVGLQTIVVKITLLNPVMKFSDGRLLSEDGIVFFSKKESQSYPFLMLASSSVQSLKIDGLMFDRLMRDNQPVDHLFIKNIVDLSVKTGTVLFPVRTISIERNGDISFLSETGLSKLLFLENMDTKKIWSTLVSAIDTEPLKGKLLHSKDSLEYIDARYGNKIFYRFSDMPFQNIKVNGILGDHAASSSFSTTTPR